MQSIGNPHILLYVLFGGGIATWVMMRWKWLPDPPPPNIAARFAVILVGGALGGLVGGVVLAGNDPMPAVALLGAGSASLVVAGSLAILGSGGRSGAGR